MTKEEAIKIIESNCSSSGSKLREACAMFIPELAESEDERIRKRIILRLQYDLEHKPNKFTKKEIPEEIAYLERQKEQKSLNIGAASEWLRKHVDIYMNSEYNEFHKCVEYDGSIDKERLINDFEEAMRKEQKPAEWSEEEKGILLECISVLQNNSCWVLADKLLSLRPHPHWKPSEEQMRVFLKANPVNLMPEELSVYNSLYNDIQKLM